MDLITEPDIGKAKDGSDLVGASDRGQNADVNRARLFSDFYESNYDQLARSLTWTLGNAELAQEAASEAFVKAYAAWSDVSQYANPQGWVFRVGLNWARSRLRKLRRPAHYFKFAESPPVQIDDPVLWAAVRSLNQAQREVVVCRCLADWSVSETAKALGIAEGTVKSRMNRAAKKLRDELEGMGYEV